MGTNPAPLRPTPRALRPGIPPAPTTLPPVAAWGLALSGTLVAVAGLVMTVFRYVVPEQDPFSAYPHAMWPWLLATHVLPTPVFIFFLGSIWWGHVVRNWHRVKRRTSGGFVVLSIAVIALTGYVLYFIGAERLLSAVRATHTVAGLAGVAFCGWHAVHGWIMVTRARRARRAQQG